METLTIFDKDTDGYPDNIHITNILLYKKHIQALLIQVNDS
jgi:hypothetical protein